MQAKQSEVLQQQLIDLAQFENLVASKNAHEYDQNYKAFLAHFKINGAQKTAILFENLTFENTDAAFEACEESFGNLDKLIGNEKLIKIKKNENKAFHFFNESFQQIKTFFSEVSTHTTVQDNLSKTEGMQWLANATAALLIDGLEAATGTMQNQRSLILSMHKLIAAQKAKLEAKLAAAEELEKREAAAANASPSSTTDTAAGANTAINPAPVSRAARLKTYAFYTTTSLVGVGGLAVTVASALMQFNPHFALLVGLHFTPAVLASVAAAGVVTAVSAAYILYRAYNPATAPVVVPTTAPVNKEYSKLLTASIMTAGFGFAAFSALVQFSPNLLQFSPKFALLIGLHLQPAALIGMAVAGVLLMSIGLYRMCKTNAQTPAPAAAAKDDTVAPVTCSQRVSQFMQTLSCCGYNLFKKADASTETADLTATNTVKVTA